MKEKLKQRIEKTFSDHMSSVRSYEYELLLQSVQCYCEDLLFKEWGIEIEQLNRVVISKRADSDDESQRNQLDVSDIASNRNKEVQDMALHQHN